MIFGGIVGSVFGVVILLWLNHALNSHLDRIQELENSVYELQKAMHQLK